MPRKSEAGATDRKTKLENYSPKMALFAATIFLIVLYMTVLALLGWRVSVIGKERLGSRFEIRVFSSSLMDNFRVVRFLFVGRPKDILSNRLTVLARILFISALFMLAFNSWATFFWKSFV